MYSPKIADEYIPEIYRAAREQGIHMTELVNEFIANGLKNTKRNKNKGIDKLEVHHEKNSSGIETGV